jgi:hypothetical protein
MVFEEGERRPFVSVAMAAEATPSGPGDGSNKM